MSDKHGPIKIKGKKVGPKYAINKIQGKQLEGKKTYNKKNKLIFREKKKCHKSVTIKIYN